MTKKICALVLSLFMVFTVSVPAVFAEENIAAIQDESTVQSIESESVSEADSTETGSDVEEAQQEPEGEVEESSSVEEPVSDTQPQAVAEIVPQLRAADSAVADIVALQAAIASAAEGDVITLADDFVFGDAVLTMPAVNVIVDGGNKVWDTGVISVSGTNSGGITIKNLKMDNAAATNRLIKNTASNGTLVLENVEIANSTAGGLDISTSGNAKTILYRVHIHDNTAGAGPAIWLGSSAKAEINYSTIEENAGTAGGYEAGAIASKNYAGILQINNTVFRKNINKAANTNVVGGGGGAMSIHYFSGSIAIKKSIFEENRTNGDDGSRASTYDGGAIYIFNMRQTASLDIEGTSFINNVAYDDGGAILIQTEGSGNGDVVDKITMTNNTFYGNKAYGVDNAMYAGGAIQIYANVGFMGTLHTKASLRGNTFAFNEAGGIADTDGAPNGGAIGLSMFSFWSTMKLNLDNNLFVGNAIVTSDGTKDTTSEGASISLDAYIENADAETINVGITPTDDLITDVLGLYEVKLSSNNSSVVAGVKEEVVPTFPIKPNGAAENKTGAEISGTDQRGIARYKDFGAIEITSIKYDPNGGSFSLAELTAYDGTVYYEGTTPTEYYTVGNADGTATVVDGLATLNATNGDKVFKGWSTDAAALEADPVYAVGQAINYTDEGLVLYAVWGTLKQVTVKYEGNGNTGGIAPVDSQNPYTENDLVTTLDKGDLVREGYTFAGWNTLADGTGTQIAAGAQFTIAGDVILYAQWTKDPVSESSTSTPESSTSTPTASTSTPPATSTAPAATPKTGDVSVLMPVVLLLSSAVAIAFVVVVLIKREKETNQ